MSGYIGKDGLDISNNFTSNEVLTNSNNWTNSKTFTRLTSACIIISSTPTTITDIPNAIIITIATLTLTFPTTMPNGIILNIRRTAGGTTTFSGPTFRTIANATMTTSTALIISLVSYNNTWWMLI